MSKMMIFLQMKKDIDLVFSKKAEITQKWKEKKAKIALEFPEIKCFLCIVTRIGTSARVVNKSFGDDIFFIFSDWNKEKTIFNKL